MAIHRLHLQEKPPDNFRGGALAIGNFDGVHRGHHALLAALKKKARALGGPAVAMTFDPHPLQLLRPDQFQPVLTTVDDRAELLLSQGAAHVIIMRTVPELLHLNAEDFFELVIRAGLDARALVEGTNFGFGHNREGTVETLMRLSRQAGIDTPTIVEPFLIEGIPVSSSRVRTALLRGKMEEASELLGREYRLRGTVGQGQRRGRQLGFPTANLEKVPTLVPGDGVYGVRVNWKGRTFAGAANVGPNPTFGESARKVEVHLIDFQGDLYGTQLGVEFVARLRDTQPFNGPEELKAQLNKDVANARRLAGVVK
jgi:riboflavin kinase/FMN adenylyltransferase